MPSTTSQPLSIAVIGAGRIGSSFAYQLHRAGHDVTVVARPGSKRLAQLERGNGIVLTTGERAEVTVADRLDERKPFDVVIVTVLAHQVDSVLPALSRSKARTVLFMFATPEAERLRAAVGAERASFGFAGVLATIAEDGKLNLKIQRVKATLEEQRWVDLFVDAGMPAKLQPDMASYLRTHAPLTIAMESVTGMGMAEGRNTRWSEARIGTRGIKASSKILKATGDKPVGLSRAPGFVLTGFLWATARAPFREAVGDSDAEARGLIDLYVAEARTKPGMQDAADALLALRPGDGPRVHLAPRTA
ncbi:MAG TPA: 2-dehydropantoate 2-reductase N-terminal domain-containing protein [Solirubrobacteraceae bacterium]|nr:2-dehydropantoate 2-reductase N-terminal domain-containing protein [Solirubrobacteraceae bacterium]